MIKFIGTHHLMEEKEIRKEIEEYQPEIVLVELCNGRISMIENPELNQKRFSLLGLISNLIKKKAKEEGKIYGNDMISAYKISKEKGIKVGLIDRPIIETNVFLSTIPFSEKWTLIKEMFKFKSKKIKMANIVNELKDTNMEEMIKEIESKAPTLAYYLITSRNEYMLMKVKSYLYDHPDKKILCFVGKGHLNFLEKNI